MFYPKKTSGEFDIVNHIEGPDIYNSRYIYNVDLATPSDYYTEDFYKGRLDLVMNKVYPQSGLTNLSTIHVLNRLRLQQNDSLKGIGLLTDSECRQLSQEK